MSDAPGTPSPSGWRRAARLWRADIPAEVDEELRFHLEMRARELVAAGADPGTARREAERRFGELPDIRHECIAIDERHRRRASRTERLMDTLQDVRFAVRALRRRPGFTLVVLLTLALGIGATTAMFSVVDGVLLRPLPYGAPERVVRVWNAWTDTPDAALSPAEYFDLRAQVPELATLGVYAPTTATLTGDGEPERFPAAAANAALWPALGVAPALGRVFGADEDRPGAARVAVLGHALWQRRFGGDPAVLGRRLLLNGQPHTVVGVMPASFALPEDFAAEEPAALYVPFGLHPDSVANRGSHFLRAVGRLADGVTLERANATLATVAARMVQQYPDDYPADMRFSTRVEPLRESVVGDVRPALLVLFGAVGCVLLIACANVASLHLARTDARAAELAVRSALGAGRARLARQLMVESLVLAAAGGALGLLVGWAATRALVRLRPADVPRLDAVGIDLRALAFTAAVVLVTALAFGLFPALRASRLGLRDAARGSSRGATAGPRLLRRALVVAEVSLALVLLAGAGLLGRSFARLLDVDPGFRAAGVLTARLTAGATTYPETAQLFTLYDRLLAQLAAAPGVAAVGAASHLPLANPLGDLNFVIEGRPVPEGEVSPRADWQVVTPGYLDAMGMRIVRGRGIERTDRDGAPGVVVINEATARRYWPGAEALGQRFTLGGGAGPGVVTVVGIVADVRHGGLDQPPLPQMYLAHEQFRFWGSGAPVRSMSVAIRADDPAAAAAALRRAVRALDAQMPIGELRTMDAVRSRALAQPRFTMLLLTLFSCAALALAAVGIYGVMAHAVTHRTREIGIRIALGARQASVAGMVLRQGMLLALLGVAIGLAGALALTRLLRSLLYEVSPTDPLTLGAGVLFLGAVALLASWLPARRASRVDPMIAMRGE